MFKTESRTHCECTTVSVSVTSWTKSERHNVAKVSKTSRSSFFLLFVGKKLTNNYDSTPRRSHWNWKQKIIYFFDGTTKWNLKFKIFAHFLFWSQLAYSVRFPFKLYAYTATRPWVGSINVSGHEWVIHNLEKSINCPPAPRLSLAVTATTPLTAASFYHTKVYVWNLRCRFLAPSFANVHIDWSHNFALKTN